jgi:peroxiredoxin
MAAAGSGRIFSYQSGGYVDMRFSCINTKRRYLICMGLGLLMVVLPSLIACTDSRQTEVQKGAPEGMAPDFSLKDLDGRNFTLSSFKGKPVLLIFLTTWCPTCRSEMPHYKSIYDTYGKLGLEVVNIDIQETKNKVSLFAEKYGVPYRMLLDEKGDVTGTYGIVGVPAMVLVGKDGKILSRKYLSMDILLETLFAKK